MEVPDPAGLETVAAQKSEVAAREQLDQTIDTIDSAVANEEADHRGTKRSANDEVHASAPEPKRHETADKSDTGNGVNAVDGSYKPDMSDEPGADASEPAESYGAAPTLSKNQQRKLKRQQMFAAKKEDRKIQRKEKRHEKQARARQEKQSEIAAAAAEGRSPNFEKLNAKPKSRQGWGEIVPVSVIIDCQFEEKMMEKEIVSLASQITRCYSDNRHSEYPVHIFVSSFGGAMKDRYETILQNHHRSWKHTCCIEGDFLEAARQAKELMNGPDGGAKIDVLKLDTSSDPLAMAELSEQAKKHKKKRAPTPEPEAQDVDKSIVYLTADSPYTLERLEPNTCYVIGGIIDKNREKGLCYKIAREKNVRTAKLPIGEFMVMQSRHVLATNHVMEIMLKWLETGNWGDAFMKVIPTRKGGTLKENDAPDEDKDGDAQADEGVPTEDAGDARDKELPPVVGDNSIEALEKNALDEQRFSAPPPDTLAPIESGEKEMQDVDTAQEDIRVEIIEIDASTDQPQAGVHNAQGPSVDVDGPGPEEGLQKNAMDEQRFSAPPPDDEEVTEVSAGDTGT
ncbi:tRNA-methyltransferase-domain-containing protein [Xylariaceae sp. FL0016]|nr:tRNA-methyltransferase-domain-containing protein [Xylariaceae sp. FL0016]